MDTNTVMPLSTLQRMLWLMNRYRRGSGVMNVPIIYRMRGDLDVDALVGALGDVEERHEALRTRVRQVGLTWMQEIGAPQPAELQVVDLSGAAEPDEARAAAIVELVRAEMEIAHTVPYRANLLRTGPDDHTLVVNVHHILTDAWSNAVICRDLAHSYNRRKGNTEPLTPVVWQFQDYLRWQEKRLSGPRLESHHDFWRAAIADVRQLSLRPVPERTRQSPPAANSWFTLDEREIAQLTELGRSKRTTLFVVLLSMFYAVLLAASGERDIAVGSIMANRVREETYGTVGLFANMVLLRTVLPPNPAFGDVLAATRRTVLQALDHQDLPYMKVPVEGRSRMAERPESVVFHMLARPPGTVPAGGLRFAGLDVTALRMPEAAGSRFDLELLMIPRPDGFDGVFRYAADQFDREYVEQLTALCHQVVRAALADPDAPLPTELPVSAHSPARGSG